MKTLLAFLLLLGSAVAQNQYYVSPSGSDSNSGTQASPWLTISHASSALSIGSAGAVVNVDDGTYGCTTTAKSGTASARIVYKAKTKYGTKVTCNPGGNGTIWLVTGSFIDIQNFEVTATGGCLGIATLANSVHVLGSYIHDIPALSANCSNGGAGIAFTSTGHSDNWAIGNIVDAIGLANGSCPNMHGIYPSNSRTILYNNIISRACGWGIHYFHQTTQNVTANNTVINNLRGGITVGASDGFTDQNVITINNIFANNGSSEGGIGDYYNGSENGSEQGWTARNNIVYNNNPNWKSRPCTPNADLGTGCSYMTVSGTIALSATQFANLFVNYTGNAKTGDYHLKTGSVAIGAGVTGACATGGLSPCIPAADFDNKVRPPNPSIGAFEGVGAAVLPPAAPTGLTAIVQ